MAWSPWQAPGAAPAFDPPPGAGHDRHPMTASADFRPDIDGLRAVAVSAVVLFHLHASGVRHGYLGVDVFFVLSGYLILRLLQRELAETGRIALLGFWARRARRLLPAASVVAVVAFLVSLAALPFRVDSSAQQLVATSVYAANFFFLQSGKSYFAEQDPRLLLHTWSLSVEEQFYVFVPLLLAAVALVARALRVDLTRHSRGVVSAVLVALAVASAAAAATQPVDVAFYASPLRAWQFCIGGLCAVALPPLRHRVVADAIAASGAVAVLAALAGVGSSWSFPWPGAWLPTLGTGALLWANTPTAASTSTSTSTSTEPPAPPTWVARLLGLPPLLALGRVSYALYLVHWPVVVLLPIAVGPRDGAAVPVAVAVLSLALSVLLHRAVENPLRFHPLLARSRAASAAMALCFAGASVGLGLAFADKPAQYQGRLAEVNEVGRSTLDTRGRCIGTRLQTLVRNDCIWGDKKAEKTVLLLGDSHAMHWLGAFKVMGERHHVRVLYSGLSACPTAPVAQKNPPVGCENWQREVAALVRSAHADFVVVADASLYVDDDRIAAADPLSAWREANRALAAALDDALADSGARAGVILDVPPLSQNALDCFAIHPAARCGATAGDLRRARIQHKALKEAWRGHPLFDVTATQTLCPRPTNGRKDAPARTCRATLNDRPMYRDNGHLTREASRALGEDIWRFVRPQLAARPASQREPHPEARP